MTERELPRHEGGEREDEPGELGRREQFSEHDGAESCGHERGE